MSDSPENLDQKSSPALDAIVGEAKTHLDVGPKDLDWSRLEANVMAAVEKEKPAVVREIRTISTRRSLIRTGTLVLAAAAAVFLFVQRDKDHGTARPVAATPGVPASDLRATEGTGQVRVGGVVATAGTVVRANDTLDIDQGTRAVLERPNKVHWLIEQDSAVKSAAHARVKSAGESLILGLENGVIEAQVVPVPQGEAFAVDVATDRGLVRVAVHGTHLRVARQGNRVVVDLTEGVVSIGNPPRTGITIGTLVTAPAHVELDATDLKTLTIDHNETAVRAAIPLGPAAAAHGSGNVTAALNPAPNELVPPPTPTPPQLLPSAPKVSAIAPTPESNNAATSPAPKPAVALSGLPPREAITAAVRSCAATHGRSDPNNAMHITVSSTLRLHISPTGEIVGAAQFVPPLAPAIQTCAAETIYKVKLEETGLVTIPIEFSY